MTVNGEFISRPALEAALEELILNQRWADFQRIALPLARERCPQLVANEIFKDGGEDGFQVSGALDDGRVLAVACSLTAEWKKIAADLQRILGRKPQVTEVWFFTPVVVTAVTVDKWRASARNEYGVELTVFSREEMVQSLLRPGYRYLIDHHLRLPPRRSSGRLLAGDLQASIDAFLDEYLVSETGPVPFGGRQNALAALDSWILSPDAPSRCLITAPAGRGKSALVVRWIVSMRERGMIAPEAQTHAGGWQLVFVPISMRFGTNEPRKFYRALAERLARITAEPVGNPLTDHEEFYAGRVRELFASLARTTQRILVVLDGLDEALGGEFDSTIVPRSLPATLRVVATARWLSGDHDSTGWLQRLDWAMHARAHSFELSPLGDVEIADVLIGMGAPLDVVAEDPALIQRLLELSMGEPIVVHYYAIDLWHKGDHVPRIKRENLDEMKPGFGAYFERWLELQRKAWRDAGDVDIHGAGAFDRLVNGVLMLFAFARGPLERQDVVKLLPALIGPMEAVSLSAALAPLRRFIVGDGTLEFGYIFSHPMIGEHLQNARFFGMERVVENAFVDWGRAVVRSVGHSNSGTVRVPHYLLRFHRSHLQAVGADVSSYMELVQDGWRQAWDSYDGFHGFAGDVRAALDVSRNSPGAGLLEDQLRCALTLSSIRSLGHQTPPALIVVAVKRGVLTLRQALHLVDTQAPEQSVQSLVGWVSEVDLHPGESCELLRMAMDIGCSIAAPRDKVEALSRIVPHLEGHRREEILREAIAALQQIERADARFMSIAAMGPHLTPQQCMQALGDALTDARAVGSEWFGLGYFDPVLAKLGAAEIVTMLSTAATLDRSDSESMANALQGLASRLSVDQLDTALGSIKQIPDQHLRGQALSALSKYLAAEQLDPALSVAGALNDEPRACALGSLAPRLDPRQMSSAVSAAGAIADDYSRAMAFEGMAPYLNAQQRDACLPAAYAAAKTGKWEKSRARTLIALALELRGQWIDDAFAHVEAFEDLDARAEALAKLAAHLVGSQFERARSGAMAAIEQDVYKCRDALTALAPCLTRAQLAAALAIASKLAHPPERVVVLGGLFPHLADDLRDTAAHAALAAASKIASVRERANALAVLAPYLNDEQVAEALLLARVIGDARDRVETLTHLGNSAEAELRDPILDAAVGHSKEIDVSFRIGAWLELIPCCRADVRRALLNEAIALVNAVDGDRYKSYWLGRIAPHLDAGQLLEALGVVKGIQNSAERAETLTDLAAHLSGERRTRVLLDALHDAQRANPLRRARALAQIAVELPDSHFQGALPLVLDAIKAPLSGRTPIDALLSLLPRMSAGQRAEAVHEARRIARALEHEDVRASLLLEISCKAGGEQGAELLEEAFATALQIRNRVSRSQELVRLAPYLNDDRLSTAIDAIEATATSFAALGKFLKGERRGAAMRRAVEAAGSMRLPREYESGRGHLLASMAGDFGAESSLQIFSVAQTLADPGGRAAAFTGILPHLSGVRHGQALALAIEAAKKIQRPNDRAEAWLKLEQHCLGQERREIEDCALAASVKIHDVDERARVLRKIVALGSAQRSQRALRELIGLGEHLSRPDFLRILGETLPAIKAAAQPEALKKLYTAIMDTAAWYP